MTLRGASISRVESSNEATEIARRSFAANPDPEAADTLARLLYARGEVAEAIEFEELAAESSEGSRGEAFRIIAERMSGRGEDRGPPDLRQLSGNAPKTVLNFEF